MNKYTGVLGVYNCQGAAWISLERKNTFHETTSNAITGYVRGVDVHLISEVASDWNSDCAIYCHQSGELVILPYNVAMPVSLKVLEHDVFTVTPVKVLGTRVSFTPVGLIEMYNAGGAIEGLVYEVKGGRAEHKSDELLGLVLMKVKGCGKFGAYSSVKPRRCLVGSNVVDFDYNSYSGLMILNLDHMPGEGQKVHIVDVEL